jgi:hypothetical protein
VSKPPSQSPPFYMSSNLACLDSISNHFFTTAVSDKRVEFLGFQVPVSKLFLTVQVHTITTTAIKKLELLIGSFGFRTIPHYDRSCSQ